jgi:hypothetical protein
VKRLAAVLAVILGLCLASGGAFAATDNAAPAVKGKAAKAGKAKSKGVKAKAGKGEAGPPARDIVLKAKPGPVTFAHAKHGAVGCRYCHHADDPGKETRCSKCHGAKTAGLKLDRKEAFHVQCKGCHTREGRGPAKCDECHRK